ncbi:MAG: LacI family DNA-binding transcriptional regulator [Bryobacteraceae bacterium]|nr:LacI family DNA-binding transcriptional regulator [Bryobacteraceae bacterium]
MKEVARRAGVSISTVSHVLNDTRPVAPVTRDRVLRIVRELNYYKNAFGRRLARGSSDAVGLIISDIENPFFPELIRNFETAAVERGLDTLICTTNYSAERAQHAVRRMIENRVQGVAVMTSQLDPALVDELVGADVPVVRLDAGPTGRGRGNIRVDYSTGAAEAARHLLDGGHRRIGFITGPLQRVSAVTFQNVLVEAIAACGLPLPHIVEGDNTMDGGEAGLRRLLEQAPDCTAVMCGHDMAALGAVRAAREMGLSVPEDISIVGADDVAFARYAQPPLTTIRVPRDALGRMAVEALRTMIRSKRRPGRESVLETRLIVRRSTGPRASRLSPVAFAAGGSAAAP